MIEDERTKESFKSHLKKEFETLLLNTFTNDPTTKLSPQWLKRTSRTLYNNITSLYRDINGNIDWSALITDLPEEVLGAWKIQVKSIRTLNSAIYEASNKLKAAGIKKASPNVIRKLDPNLADYFYEHDLWDKVEMGLKKYWDGTWEHSKKNFLSFEDSIKNLLTLLEINTPLIFSPKWIEKNSSRLYQFFENNVRDKNNKIDWDKIISSLPVQYKKIWRYTNKREPKNNLERYSNPKEFLELGINEHEQIILMSESPEDYEEQNKIYIKLVKLCQKGNSEALQKLWSFVQFQINNWVDKIPNFHHLLYDSTGVKNQFERAVNNFNPNYEGTNFIKFLYSYLVNYSQKNRSKFINNGN